ncbi:rhodanese-like domain-containing protein [Streptomyces sp. HNM0574]|uniref:rhodanese-like domain-containing protein n=1 Tax=Streptomyces sp. HNM0574 TaxID=2714954 RepID=UPI00146C6838|nr:rhodanese-like domain-containing protein [Streptomyces sp. HNM0574]NLU70551.1 rhodanese-like domain-containing protein [Streptomyces sp. HNM0574]
MITSLTPEQALPRLDELTVVDVRTPGEYASGHVPGAHNVPLDQLGSAVPALRTAAGKRELLLVCASGNRSAQATGLLAEHGVEAADLAGGTSGWSAAGHPLEHPAEKRATWAMERQVRFAAGSLVLTGLIAGRRLPAVRLLSAGVAGGLVFSALTDTCGMARVLAKLPHNRPCAGELADTLDALAS